MYKTVQLILLFSIIGSVQTAWAGDGICGKRLIVLRDNSKMPFMPHLVARDPASVGNSLALNVNYAPIAELRGIIETVTGRSLKFFTEWNANGEAHVTTTTPPEFVQHLRHHLTMQRIHEIASENRIQDSDMKILGLGSGRIVINGSEEETFFIIVDSHRLREIRYKIYEEFVENGGNPSGFDPTKFFPHITIGYTLRDLHENDGVIKDVGHSLDLRFGRISLREVNR